MCAQVGKKKTMDVQLYTEVMESVQTIDAGRRSMYDPEELEEEQRERDAKNRVRGFDFFFLFLLPLCCLSSGLTASSSGAVPKDQSGAACMAVMFSGVGT